MYEYAGVYALDEVPEFDHAGGGISVAYNIGFKRQPLRSPEICWFSEPRPCQITSGRGWAWSTGAASVYGATSAWNRQDTEIMRRRPMIILPVVAEET